MHFVEGDKLIFKSGFSFYSSNNSIIINTRKHIDNVQEYNNDIIGHTFRINYERSSFLS